LAATIFDDPELVPEAQAFGRLVRAHQLAGLGRWQEAMEQLRAAESLDQASALEDRALLVLAPFAPVDRTDLTALFNELEEWDAESVPASLSGNPWIVPHEGFHPALRLYLLGGVQARLGEYAAALTYADRLSGPDGESADAVIRNTLARDLRAFVAFTEGRPADGLLELEAPGLRGAEARPWERAYSSPFFSESLGRFEGGQASAQMGDNQAAHTAFASIWMSNSFDLAYMAPSHFARAELSDQDGDPVQALRHYRRFVELWQDADAEFAERVAFARERIRVLEG
jgi:tetratricopeptide (TPR) repeat protein